MRVLPGWVAAVLVASAVGVVAAGPGQAPRATQARPRTAPTPAAKRAAPAPAPRVELPVPFRVGETLTFDVAWSGYLVAGSAVTRVVEKRPSYNSTAYYIVADGRPLPIIARLYPLYYKMDSLLDSFTGLAQRTSIYQEEGDRKKYYSTLFNRPARKAVIERRDHPGAKTEIESATDAQDGLALLYALRTRPIKAGDRFTFPVIDDGNVYSVSFDVGAAETVRVPFGQVNAWNLRIGITDANMRSVGSKIAVWLSDDARRLPLKLQADLPVGAFVLALRTVQTPPTR